MIIITFHQVFVFIRINVFCHDDKLITCTYAYSTVIHTVFYKYTVTINRENVKKSKDTRVHGVFTPADVQLTKL